MIPFAKYHGCGNSFVIVKEQEVRNMDYSRLAQATCNINTGIGADGFMVVRQEPELEMVFYNQDGSSAPMCGNGIRCFAAFCYHEGIIRDRVYSVKTLAGEMMVTVLETDPFLVKIHMGSPSMNPKDFGVSTEREDYLQIPMETSEGTFIVNSLFMGTVHTVVWVDAFPSEEVGRQISQNPVYTEQTNVNFVKRIDSKTLEVRTYERGVGMTPACGTGACASLVVGRLQGKCDSIVTVQLPYGSLVLEQQKDGGITMSGPAIKVMDGTYTWEDKK